MAGHEGWFPHGAAPEAAPPYSTFTVLLLLSGKEVGAAESALPLRAAAAAGIMSARPQRAAKSMVLSARRIDGFAVCVHALLQAALYQGRIVSRRSASGSERSYSSMAPKLSR